MRSDPIPPHAIRAHQQSSEVTQGFLERDEVVGAVARMEDRESDDAERRPILLDLVSVDGCHAVSWVLERSTSEGREHYMLHAVMLERGELG